MSVDDIQMVVNVFGIVAVTMLAWLLVKITIYDNNIEVKDNDWVIDYCAGKPYKKGLK